MRGENFPLTTRNLPLLIRKISTVYIAADAVAISKAIKFYLDLIAETSGMGTTRGIILTFQIEKGYKPPL